MSQEWIEIQLKTFTAWVNVQLKKVGVQIESLVKGMETGENLVLLIESLTGKTSKVKPKKDPQTRIHKIQNAKIAIDMLREDKMELVNISAEDVVNGSQKIILALVWRCILKFQITKAYNVQYEEEQKQKGLSINPDSVKQAQNPSTAKIKKELLEWVQNQVKGYGLNVNDFTNSYKDGRVLRCLVHSLKGTGKPEDFINSIEKDDPLTLNTEAIALAEDKLDIPALVDAQDVTDNPEELSMMTYISYFREYQLEHPGIDATKSEVALDDLITKENVNEKEVPVLVEQPTIFHIVPRDSNGNVVKDYEDYDIQIDGPSKITPVRKLEEDGITEVTFTPTKEGKHKVSVTVNGKHIKNSPFNVEVKEADVCTFVVEGEGLKKGKKDVPSKFNIAKRNNYGQNKEIPIGDLKVVVEGPCPIQPKITTEEDGSISVEYTPKVPGKHSIDVLVNGEPVVGSPFNFTAKSGVDKTKVTVDGHGIKDASVDQIARFTITSRDAQGNIRGGYVDTFNVDIDGPEKIPVKISNNGDGTYDVSYVPKVPGKYKARITTDNGDVVQGSPFNISVKEGADASKSSVGGQGLKSALTGEIAKFTIISKDKDNKRRQFDHDEFDVEISDKNGESIPTIITSNKDGTYDVHYTPKKSGKYKINVGIGGKDVKGTFEVDVKSGSDLYKTTVEGLGVENGKIGDKKFQITSKDKHGTVRSNVIDNFNVSIEGPSQVTPIVTPNNDGTYDVTYKAEKPGDYKIHISSDDQPLGSSPFSVKLSEHANPASSSYEGLMDGKSGEKSQFRIIPKNEKGEKTKEKENVEVKFDGPDSIKPIIVSNGDGDYICEFTPNKPGDYKVSVFIGGEEISRSPGKINVKSGCDVTRTTASGPGLNTPKTAKSKNKFKITAKDKDGKIRKALDNFEVKISGDAETKVTPNGDGTYDVQYSIAKPGSYDIHVTSDGREISNSPFHIDVIEGSDPSKVTVDGLKDGKTGEKVKFKLSNLKDNDEVTVDIEGDFTDKIETKIVPSKDGFNVEFVPKKIAKHYLNVKVNGTPIPTLNVDVTSGADNSKSSVEVPKVAKVGEKTEAKIIAKGKKGEDRGNYEDDFKVTVNGSSNPDTKLTPNGDGTYTVSFTPDKPGKHTLSVSINGSELKGSPYNIDVKNGPNNSKTVVTDIKEGQTGVPTKFKITPKDKDGKIIPKGENQGFDVKVNGPNAESKIEIKPKKDSSYDVSFIPKIPGDHKVTVLVKDKPIFESTTVNVKSGTDAFNTIAQGSGLEDGNIQGNQTSFNIITKDFNGDTIVDPTDIFEIMVDGPTKILPDQTNKKDGTYDVNYTPQQQGRYLVDLSVSGEALLSSPYDLVVKSSADKNQIKIEGPGLTNATVNKPSQFTITSKNKDGKVRSNYKDEFNVHIMNDSHDKPKTQILSNGDGTYTVIYTCEKPGPYNIKVFLDGDEVGGPYQVDVKLGADPNLCEVTGDGIISGKPKSGELQKFVIESRDKKGKRPNEKDEFDVKIEGPEKSFPKVKPLGDGKYEVEYLPKIPGKYKIVVTTDEKQVKNSPFNVQVVSGADINNSSLEGVKTELKAGDSTSFKIISKDAKGNLRKDAEDDYSVVINGPSNPEIKITPNNDGTYLVEYRTIKIGTYDVKVTLDGKDLKGSPFKVNVIEGAYAMTCTAKGDGIKDGNKTGVPTSFTITSKDRNGVVRKRSDDNFNIKFKGPENIVTKSTPKGDGDYVVTYTPKIPGKYEIEVTNGGKSIRGSPFEIEIKSGATTVVPQGKGLTDGRIENNNQFTISSKDKDGNLRKDCQDTFTVKLQGPEVIDAEVKPNNNGTYTVTYNPSRTGKYNIHIAMDGNEIPNGPFIVNVSEGADIMNSKVDGQGIRDGNKTGYKTEFTVTCKDENGKLRPKDGDDVIVNITGPEKVIPVVTPNDDGLYIVEYTPKKLGKYQVDVLVNGKKVNGSPFNVTMKSGADPYKSQVDGFTETKVKKRSNFRITAKNKKGENFTDGENDFVVEVQGPGEVKSHIKPRKDGIYDVDLTAPIIGKYMVSCSLNGTEIKGSPFQFYASQNADPIRSTVEGDGLTSALTGNNSKFKITSKDKDGRIRNDNDIFDLDVFGPEKNLAKVHFNPDTNSYEVKYTPKLSGDHTIDIKVNGREIKGSSFKVDIKSSADPLQTSAKGPGVTDGNKSGNPTSFLITARDKNKKQRTEEDDIKVIIDGPVDVSPIITSNKDGTYTIDYTPTSAGNYKIHTLINGNEINGSPFDVQVISGADPYNSEVSGKLLKTGGRSDLPAKFTITSKDRDGTVRDQFIDEFNVLVTGPEKIIPKVTPNGDGTYDVTFTPKLLGNFKVEVSSNGRNLRGTPFDLLVVPRADPEKTTCDGKGLKSGNETGDTPNFTVTVRDRDGNLRKVVDDVQVKFEGPGPVDYEIIQKEDSKYYVEYKPRVPGDYKISVTLDGKNVKDSPFNVKILPGADPTKSICEGDGLKKGKSGEVSTFIITSKDKDGNKRSKSNDEFDIQIEGQGKVDHKVSSNGDGTYTVEYTPKKPGKHNVKVKLHGEFVTGTPVDVNVLSGADATQCIAEGNGLRSGTKTGRPAKFKIHAFDKDGKPRQFEDQFNISIKGPETLPCEIVWMGDGIYECTYYPKVEGKYEIDILMDDQKIKTSHFDVNIVLPADPTKTYVEGKGLGDIETAVLNTFQLVPKDKNGNIVVPIDVLPGEERKIDEFKFDFDGPDNIKPNIKLNDNGIYDVSYTAMRPGLYTVTITTDQGKDVVGSPFFVNCIPGADPDNSYAKGSGLITGKMGDICRFKIFAIDKNGEPRPSGVDEFIIDFDGPGVVIPTITPNKDGVYDVEYVAKEKGKYLIGITVGDKDIKGSPYFVDIHSGFCAQKTFAEGPGLKDGIKPNSHGTFFVIPRDSDGNPILILPEEEDEGMMVEIDGPEGFEAPFKIDQNEEGIFNVDYVPSIDGKYKIRVAINGEEIKGSPYNVYVAPYADPNTSTAEGPGLRRGRPNIANKFKVFPRDKDGNLIPPGNDDIKVDIEGPGEVTTKVKQCEDGTYDTEYSTAKDGRYRIKIFVNGRQIKASPYVVQVKPGANPLTTTADGPGLRSGLRPGRQTEFTITSRDKDGKIRKELDEFDILITAPVDTPSTTTPNNDGTYTVKYTPLLPGFYSVSIKVDDQDISKSPFKFEITPGADPLYSYCDGPGLKGASSGDKNYFKIYARDKYNKPRPSGEDEFLVNVDGDYKTTIVKVTPLPNGEYEVCYIPKRPGQYQIHVGVEGKNLKDSPYNVVCVLGADPDRCYAEGPGLLGAKQGQETHFTIFAKDKDGKDRFGDDEFDLEFEGPGPVEYKMTPYKDGTYDVTYMPTTHGKHMISIQLDGNDIRKAPFFIDVSQEVDFDKSTVEGNGIKNGIKPGRNARFTVVPRDYNGVAMNIQEKPGEEHENEKEMNSEIDGPVPTKRKITPQVNGSYIVDYVPEIPGKYIVKVSLLDTELKKSPYIVNVTPFADPTKCTVDGPGLRCPRPEIPNRFTITLRDKDGNLLPPGDDDVQVEIFDGPKPCDAKVKQNEDGTYTATYIPEVEGKYKIKVSVDGNQIKGSPFDVHVKPGASPLFTTAEGPGLGEGNRPGDICYFRITSRDKFGNERVDENDEFDVQIDGPLRAPVKIVPQGNARYDVMYVPKVPGKHKIKVTVDDQLIKDSPFSVLIDQGADPFNTTVEGEGLTNSFSGQRNYFTIYPKDKDGNERAPGTDDFQVEFDGPGKVHTQVIPNEDGTYTVEFIPRRCGYYKCRILVGGEDINQSPLDIDVKLGAYPPNCTLEGKGLSEASVDRKSYFTIIARDKDGKSRFGYDDFDIDIEMNDIVTKCSLEMTHNHDGTVVCEYIPDTPGQYLFGVTLNGIDIDGSPFFVDVKNTLDPYKTIVKGIKNGIKPDKEAQFTIIPMDTRGKPFYLIDILPDTVKPGEEVEVTINHQSKDSAPTKAYVIPKEDGSYDVKWIPKLIGDYKIKIALDKKELKGSPYRVNVTPYADPTKTIVEGYGIKVGRPDVVNKFKIIPKDKNNMNIPPGDDNVKVTIDGPSSVTPKIISNEDGSYSVEYIPTVIGDYDIKVTIYDDQDVKGSVFKVPVKLGACPIKSTAEGPGLKDGLYPGIPTKFVITARDKDGKIRKELDEFEVQIAVPFGTEPTFAKITPNNNGTYSVEYKPKNSGQHTVTVSVDGNEILKSPFFVQVVQTADPNKTFMDGPGLKEGISGNNNEFTIHPRDKDGNLRPPKSDFFDVEFDGPGTVQVNVVPNDNGTYSVTYIPSRPGTYKINVSVAGKPLKDSPVTVDVLSSVDPNKTYLEGDGLKEAKVGEESKFTIHAKDKYGDPRFGNDEFDVYFEGALTCPITVVPNKDGTYDCTYIPKSRGKHQLKVAVDGKDLKGSVFTIDVKGLDPTAYAKGDGLKDAKENEKNTFLIISHKGEKLVPEGFEIEVDGPATAPFTITPLNDGSLQVDYIPKIPGTYKISIDQIGTSPLIGSPFVVLVKPGLDPSKTTVRGIDYTPITGEKSRFIIDAKDKDGKPYISIKDFTKDISDFQVVINGVEKLPCKIIPNDDGTYQVSYVPKINGKYKIDVLAGGKEVKGSPFNVEARGGDPQKSTAEGKGLKESIAKEPSNFVVTIRDKEGKRRMHDDNVTVRVDGVPDVSVKIEPNGNGIYEVTYESQEPGNAKIRIFVDDLEIKQSPYDVYIEPNIDLSKCSFEGPDKLIAEKPHKFTVVMKDNVGKMIPFRPNRIKMFVEPNEPLQLIDLGNGVYQANYTPKKIGKQLVRAQVDGKDIGNPIECDVKAKLSNLKSNIKFNGNSLNVPLTSDKVKLNYTIHPRDQNGLLIKDAGKENFKVEVLDSTGNTLTPLLKDNTDGTIDVTFETAQPSIYKTSCQVDGVDIQGSPLDISVTHPIDPENTIAEGPGTKKCYAGLPTSFIITPKDKDEVPILKGGIEFDVEVYGPNNEPIRGTVLVDDDGNGKYECVYTPDQVGPHKIEVKYGDKLIKKAPYFVNSKPIDQAPYPPNCYIKKPRRAVVNDKTTFQVVLVDKDGNDIISGDDWIKVKGPEGLPITIKDNETGRYDVSFVPETVGPMEFNVKVCGEKIKESPCIIDIKNGAKPDASKSSLVGSTVYIHAPNVKIEEFDVTIESQKTKLIPIIEKTTSESYTLYFSPKDKTETNISIKLNDKPIKGSPYSQKYFEK